MSTSILWRIKPALPSLHLPDCKLFLSFHRHSKACQFHSSSGLSPLFTTIYGLSFFRCFEMVALSKHCRRSFAVFKCRSPVFRQNWTGCKLLKERHRSCIVKIHAKALRFDLTLDSLPLPLAPIFLFLATYGNVNSLTFETCASTGATLSRVHFLTITGKICGMTIAGKQFLCHKMAYGLLMQGIYHDIGELILSLHALLL